ncbi:hypothetical protein SO802_013417 [Lithocarpus litseifolius]|uniref:Signal peptidase complex subunit 3 n=1 Tax=Lithocarpus litseifolius TaxID=425828 RepID=A0AAW2DB13_9ROSI
MPCHVRLRERKNLDTYTTTQTDILRNTITPKEMTCPARLLPKGVVSSTNLTIGGSVAGTTKISLWDGIIASKEHAKFWTHTSNKYRFIDQGSNLRGKEFNLTLHWHVMPKTGKMFADKLVMSGYRLPKEYR